MNLKYKATLIIVLLLTMNFSSVFARVPIIRFQTEDNFPPFKFTHDNRYMGFDADLSNLIFKSDDYFVEYSTDTWENVYSRLKNGDIDTSGLTAVSEKRKQEVLFTEPVLQTYHAVYTKKDIGPLKLGDIKNYHIGAGRGQYSEELLRGELGVTEYFTYTNIEQAIDALVRGEIQVLFENQEVVNYLLIQKGLKGEIIPQVTKLYSTDIAYGVSKKNLYLVDYINTRIDELRENGIYEELYEKYFFTHSEYYNGSRRKQINTYIVIIVISIIIAFAFLQIYIVYLKRKIHREQGLSKSILESAEIFILIWRTEGTLLRFNKYAQRVTGFTEDEVVGNRWMGTIIESSDIPDVSNIFAYPGGGSSSSVFEKPVLCKNGTRIDVIWNSSIIYDEGGNPDIVVLMGIDITELKKAQSRLEESYQELEGVHEELAATEEELRTQYDELQKNKEALEISQERYKLAVEGANDGLWDIDFKTGKVFYSSKCKEMLGYDDDEVPNDSRIWARYVHQDDMKKFKTSMRNHFTMESPSYIQELRLKTRDGSYKWVLCRGKAIFDSNGKPVRVAGSLTDIDGRKIAEQTIHNMAYYDILTGLPNRTMLYERISAALLNASRRQGKFAIIFMDLDNFKSVNDTLGHDKGDALLKNIAELLKDNSMENGMVTRLGGDEFVFLITNVKSLSDITDMAEKVLELLQQPIIVGEHELYISASMGIAVYPNDGSDAGTLLKNADTAMYYAKETGKSNYKLYTSEMNARIVNKINLENNLRQAVKQGEFKVFYQPQVDIATGNITGMEALIRWLHPEYGYIPPSEFIPVAEETGLIISIDEFVLRKACAQNKAWQDAGHPPVHISVNLSARQFQNQNLIETVSRILNETGMNPEWLVLEITESAALKDFEFTVKVIRKLMDMSIQVSLDDFGTGYSSLYYLKQLPINMLKIDKSFVGGITNDSKEENIINALIMLSQSIGIKVVAEGVETENQFAFLKDKGCDMAQGYLFKRPMPPDDVEHLIRTGKIII